MATSDSPAWEVIGQVPDVGANDQGVFVQGVTVTYRTASGVVGKVFVPQSQFTADQVRAIVTERAGHSEAVAQLKG